MTLKLIRQSDALKMLVKRVTEAPSLLGLFRSFSVMASKYCCVVNVFRNLDDILRNPIKIIITLIMHKVFKDF